MLYVKTLAVCLFALVQASSGGLPADTVPPWGKLVDPAEFSVITGNIIQFSARAGDSGSGVKEVRYPFRNSDCVLCGRCVTACTGLFGQKAIGFVGRGKDRHVESPFNLKNELCTQCGRCIDLCPMTITPCEGPMLKGRERLCGNCESKMFTDEAIQGYCFGCYMGEGFGCERAMNASPEV